MLRIVSLNTWKCEGPYRQRLGVMSATLRDLQPDVVMLQEAFASETGGADTAAQLAQALGLVATVAPARRKPRWFEGAEVDSSSGLALLTRQPPREQHVLALPADPRDGERIAQVVRLLHGGRALWLAHLHLTHLPDASALRSRQLGTVLSFCQTRAAGTRWVLGGDFNAGPGQAEFDGLLRPPWGLVQPWTHGPKITHRSDDGRALDLDHLLLAGWPHDAVLQTQVVEAGSDHAAVLLDLAD